MKRMNERTLVMVSILGLMVLALALPLTLGFLTSTPGALENQFSKPYVPPVIVEEFDGETKSAIRFKNNGNVSAYIRAALVIQAKTKVGEEILAYHPVSGTDFTLSPLGSDWFKKGDYYYYKYPVAPGNSTHVMFSQIKALKMPIKTVRGIDYYLNVDVAVQSIQSLPAAAVQQAWPVTVETGAVLAPTP